MDHWYFAYGSNLHQGQLLARCGGSLSTSDESPRIARLANYRLVFNMDGGDGEVYANIATPGDGVLGVVYRCSTAALARLDVYEEGYDRLDVVVIGEQENSIPAIAYIARPENVTTARKPNQEYLETILRGAREHGLPQEYIRQLAAIASSVLSA